MYLEYSPECHLQDLKSTLISVSDKSISHEIYFLVCKKFQLRTKLKANDESVDSVLLRKST